MTSTPFVLAVARMNKGLSQRALAAKVGVGLETVRRLENGLGARPANAKKVADFFDVQVTDLLPLEEAA